MRVAGTLSKFDIEQRRALAAQRFGLNLGDYENHNWLAECWPPLSVDEALTAFDEISHQEGNNTITAHGVNHPTMGFSTINPRTRKIRDDSPFGGGLIKKGFEDLKDAIRNESIICCKTPSGDYELFVVKQIPYKVQ